MKLKVGQFWVNSRNAHLAFKITRIDEANERRMCCLCEIWYRPGNGCLYYLDNSRFLLVTQPEFRDWTLLHEVS